MEVHFDKSRIINQFLPSLLHLATVKVGFLLKKKFDYATLMKAYKRIQEGALIDFDEIHRNPNFLNHKEPLLKCKLYHLQCKDELLRCRKIFSVKRDRRLELRRRALEKRKNLLQRNMIEYFKIDPLMKQYKAEQILNHKIPSPLIPRVIEAVHGMEFGVRGWNSLFDTLELKDEERRFCWKSDGSVDDTETARQMALNENIDIEYRFLAASYYCFEEIMHALWSEMETSNETEFFTTFDNTTVQFWVRRMLCKSPVHWKHDFCDYLHRYPEAVTHFIDFFPLLPPQDREVFLPYLEDEKIQVFRRCFNVMTNEEEEWILQSCPRKLLLSFLKWPLRSMFLETADKLWNYIDQYDFLFILERLFLIKKYEQFDISNLFRGFWKRSPRDFRRSVRHLPFMKEKIKSWLKEIRKKEKAHFKEIRSLTNAGVVETHGKSK